MIDREVADATVDVAVTLKLLQVRTATEREHGMGIKEAE